MRAKSNIGPDQGGFAYRLEQIELEQHAGVFASRALWGEPIEGTAREPSPTRSGPPTNPGQ